MIERGRFWDEKVLAWEADRYGQDEDSARRPGRMGRSLRFRMALTHRLLAEVIPGKRVLEVGCGSGRLLQLSVNCSPAFLRGIDLSAAAIERARDRLKVPVAEGRVALEVGDIGAVDIAGYDCVVGLGILDWISDDELLALFTRIHPASFLFSISERRANLAQFLHRAYVWMKYGHRTQGYVPRYQTVSRVCALAGQAGYPRIYVLRDRRLSFGALVATWPLAAPPDLAPR